MLVVRDELTGLLYQLGAEGHEGDREFYLTAWNGDTEFKIDRIGRGSLVIPTAIVSMVGGIQPGKLDATSDKLPKGAGAMMGCCSDSRS